MLLHLPDVLDVLDDQVDLAAGRLRVSDLPTSELTFGGTAE